MKTYAVFLLVLAGSGFGIQMMMYAIDSPHLSFFCVGVSAFSLLVGVALNNLDFH